MEREQEMKEQLEERAVVVKGTQGFPGKGEKGQERGRT